MTTIDSPRESPPRRLPAVFLSHGAPPLADDAVWTEELSAWAQRFERPSSILVVSAHWEHDPLTVGATTTVPLYYDFWGFEARYYEVTYPAPGAPWLADQVGSMLSAPDRPIYQDPNRGLDHGAYVPLVEMYPEADVPVLQISMPTLDPAELFDIGRRLAPLRDQGVLIMGSGFTTHNLREMDRSGTTTPTWSREFDDWMATCIAANDIDALIDFQRTAPAARIAHPRTEHFAPLFVSLGAASAGPFEPTMAIEGFWYGLSKRSVQLD